MVIRRNRLSFINASGGEKAILLAFVSGVDFQDPRKGIIIKGGFMRILQVGGGNFGNSLGGSIGSLIGPQKRSFDENTIFFGEDKRDDFLDLKDAIEERLNEFHSRR